MEARPSHAVGTVLGISVRDKREEGIRLGWDIRDLRNERDREKREPRDKRERWHATGQR